MSRLHLTAPEPRAYLGAIPDGPEGVRVTLELMRRLVREWRSNPEIIALARHIVSSVAQKDFTGEVSALQNFVRDSIRYTQDVNEVETVQAPNITLQTAHGDCDDQSVLLATLLEAVGHPTRFAAIGFEPDNFEHVYVETLIGRNWESAETTEPVPVGWMPEGVVSKMVRHI